MIWAIRLNSSSWTSVTRESWTSSKCWFARFSSFPIYRWPSTFTTWINYLRNQMKEYSLTKEGVVRRQEPTRGLIPEWLPSVGVHCFITTLDIRVVISIINHQISLHNRHWPEHWTDYVSTFCMDNIFKFNVTREHICDDFNKIELITDKNGRNGIIIL